MTLDRRQLRLQDWAPQFDEKVLARGRSYAKLGMVRILQVTTDAIEARCHGTAERPYRQHIRLHAGAEHWRVEGRCSCPVGGNCKHVAAVLITLEQLQQRNDPLAIPVEIPQAEREQLIEDLMPQPLLRLGSHRRLHFDGRRQRMLEQTQHRAALAFLYDGHQVGERHQPYLSVRDRDGQRLRIRRQPEQEALLRAQLLALGLQPALRRSEALPEQAGEPFELKDQTAWLSFVRKELPRLRAQGWQIEMSDDFHFDLKPVQRWYASVNESSGHDWFDLEMGILVEGRRISLLPILLRTLRSAPWLLDPQNLAQRGNAELLLVELPLGEGRVGLPYGRLRPLLAVLGELYFDAAGENDERLRLNRADAARLQQLETLELDWQGGDSLRALGARLSSAAETPLAAPAGLRAQLRTYQAQGLAWMQTLRELGMGGVLADDMGLGKTLQSLAHLLLEKQSGRLHKPALIVMPTSLIGNWQEEATRFTPQLRVLALQGPKRSEHFAQLERFDLILTTYALLPRDLPTLRAQPFSLLILDEAQTIKNPRSKAAIAARELHAEQRLCLTGTPLENHLGELWALFQFLNPGWLGDESAFNRLYRQPIERGGDNQRLAHLNARVRPFMLRRRKEEVARELPPKSEIIHWVELSEAQRDRYETLRLAMDGKLREEIRRQGLAGSRMLILEALLRLRQVCCDLRLLGDEQPTGAAQSAKLSALMRMLDELFAEGRRVLLFSQFTSMLELIAEELRKRRIPYAQLTGATRDRQAQIHEFQDGDLPIFLISLKAGGAGLNLTAADTVIHFDPWWNPAVEAQASDRAYRIGQDKPVFVYRLIARGSIEEKIQQLQQHKAELARGVLEGNAGGWSLEQEDLDQLLSPLS